MLNLFWPNLVGISPIGSWCPLTELVFLVQLSFPKIPNKSKRFQFLAGFVGIRAKSWANRVDLYKGLCTFLGDVSLAMVVLYRQTCISEYFRVSGGWWYMMLRLRKSFHPQTLRRWKCIVFRIYPKWIDTFGAKTGISQKKQKCPSPKKETRNK